MPEQLPALCLIAMPGRRRRTIELCQEAERRGFAGIYVPSPIGNMSLCEALAWQHRVGSRSGSSIQPIYLRPAADLAQTAASSRAHRWSLPLRRRRHPRPDQQAPRHRGRASRSPTCAPTSRRIPLKEGLGELPPIVVAALRQRMVPLAVEIAGGGVCANVRRCHMRESLSACRLRSATSRASSSAT